MSDARQDAAGAASTAGDTVRHLDARGLLCPLPVIRVQDAVRDLAAGDLLDVLATDPGVLQDIPAWCQVHGHRVTDSWRDGLDIRIRIEVCET